MRPGSVTRITAQALKTHSRSSGAQKFPVSFVVGQRFFSRESRWTGGSSNPTAYFNKATFTFTNKKIRTPGQQLHPEFQKEMEPKSAEPSLSSEEFNTTSKPDVDFTQAAPTSTLEASPSVEEALNAENLAEDSKATSASEEKISSEHKETPADAPVILLHLKSKIPIELDEYTNSYIFIEPARLVWVTPQHEIQEVPITDWDRFKTDLYNGTNIIADQIIADVYYHKIRNHLVVICNDKHNALDRLLGKTIADAKADLNRVMDFIKAQVSSKTAGDQKPSVTLTGFGYGAAFAEAVVHYAATRDDELDIESVTFNSAGAQPLVDQIFSKFIKANERPRVRALGYLSPPDAINTAYQQASRAIQLPIPLPIPELLDPSILMSARNMLTSWAFLSWVGRTATLSVKFSIDDFIYQFDSETGGLRETSLGLLREVRKWPVSRKEKNRYTKVASKFSTNVALENIGLSSIQKAELDACYHSIPLNVKQAKLEEFTPEMCLYLNAYVRTNGQIGIKKIGDPILHAHLMKFSLDHEKVVIHSVLSAEDFKRYVKKRANELTHEELFNYRSSGIFFALGGKYFTNNCRLFTSRVQASRTYDLSDTLSTVTPNFPRG